TKGSREVDACAGAGGKTLHISNLMQNSGQIVALDTEEWKLTELKLRARRAGAGNIETRLIDSNKVIKRLEGSADFLLLDVPCSGLGVLKRNPDAKWKLKPGFLDDVRTKQAEILDNYCTIVKNTGVMVYATCSLLPSENQNQIERFLKTENGKQFEKINEQILLPSKHLTDGFYMCKLKRI
ncbi:MAG: RsmB/NOP family class I SAM-dependent RNA methyltransferase, partial [Cytophagales bacterium]